MTVAGDTPGRVSDWTGPTEAVATACGVAGVKPGKAADLTEDVVEGVVFCVIRYAAVRSAYGSETEAEDDTTVAFSSGKTTVFGGWAAFGAVAVTLTAGSPGKLPVPAVLTLGSTGVSLTLGVSVASTAGTVTTGELTVGAEPDVGKGGKSSNGAASTEVDHDLLISMAGKDWLPAR